MRFDLKTPPPKQTGIGSLLIFAIFWCGITGAFVGIMMHSFWRAADAHLRYVPVTGTVLASEVKSHSGSDGTTYGFGIRYRYAVNGTTYEGNRYAFGSGS